MARHDPVELAKAAYAAYGEATGGRTYDGRLMPGWDDLGDTIQNAWAVAAHAVFKAVVTPPRSEGTP